MLLNQLRSCQGKPSATKIDDFFHGGWFKKQNCNFSMYGQKNTKNTKSPPPRKKRKRKKTSSIFLSEISNMLTQNKAQF